MRIAQSLSVLALVAAFHAGCYHATIDTGLTPSLQTIERPWAHSFIGGLVPPDPVETDGRCPNGVARVETKLSFLNMVVGAITGGIYTPMSITVRCAAAGPGVGAGLDGSGGAAMEAALGVSEDAVGNATTSGETVLVHFE